MSDKFKPKTALPTRLAVLICKLDASGNLYPQTRLDEREDGHMVIVSGAGLAPLGIGILERAHGKCVQIATQQAAEKIHAQLSSGLPLRSTPGPATDSERPEGRTTSEEPNQS